MIRDEELAFTPAYRLRKLVAEKKVSPVELTELCLRRIEALNPRLNAFLTIAAKQALASARAAEDAIIRGDELGPLHGIPVSIKDLVPTKGIRTTRGSLIYKDWVPEHDEIVVERIRQAGAVIIGKTNTPEFGQSGTCENRLGDACRNPWNTERTSGGSSGGAAASVASGLTSIALGNDGGGSVRIPASFCGIYGIKPTQGRVPRRSGGLASWHPVRFSQEGPLTRTVRDAAILLQVISGPHPDGDPYSLREEPPGFVSGLDKSVKGLRIAWSADLGSASVDPEVRQTAEDAVRVFEEMGANVEVPALHVDMDELTQGFMAHFYAGVAATMGREMDEYDDLLTDYVRRNIREGLKLTASEYYLGLARIERFRTQMRDLFSRYDILVTPTLAVPAFPVGQNPDTIDGRPVDPRIGFHAFTYPFNVSGNPVASVPCGFSADGLPIGLQIVGRPGDEVMVLRASAAFEEARPWADKRPPVS